MAVSNQFFGELVGYREFTKDNKTTCTYLVLVKQRPDRVTNIPTEAGIFEIKEDKQVLQELKAGQRVSFWEEERHKGKDSGGGTYKVCVCIEVMEDGR